MKRKILAALAIALLLFSIGCQSINNNASVDDANQNNGDKSDNTDNNSENNINTYYTIKNDSEGDLCAVIFLGYGEDEMKKNFAKIAEEYKLPLVYEDSNNYVKVDMTGDEWYLILPKYKDSSVSITHLALNDNGEEVKDGSAIETTQPVLLQCNVSDIYGSSEVVVTYNNQSVTFSPRISLKDGTIIDIENAYTH